MRFLDPKTDFAFTRIFGNDQAHDVLIHFLNSLLGLKDKHAVVEVKILNPYLAPRIAYQKHSFLDVKCVDQRGIHFVVEMQVQYIQSFEKRIIYNASKAYVNQLARGESYPQLNQVIAINILDFILFDDIKEYHTKHLIKEDLSNNCYLRDIQYHFIELPKFNKIESGLTSMADRWIYFIKEAGHLENIPESLEIEPYKNAFEIANIAGMSKEELASFEAASIALQDEKGIVEAAWDKGKTEGKIEGLKEAIELGLELKYGVQGLKLLEQINKITSVERLETIKEALKISKMIEEIAKLL
jgi:predicted transposase/invertase (TIGR01784 family)